MTCGIYKVTNTINGKFYIGRSVEIEQRWNNHRRGDGHGWYLWNAMKKYGSKNFVLEILEICDAEYLDEKEDYWIQKLNPEYNLIRKGEKGVLHHSDSSREKMSKARMGHEVTQETREKISRSSIGKIMSPEAVKKMRSSHVGKDNHQTGRHHLHSAETKLKMSISRKLYLLLHPEAVAQIGKSMMGNTYSKDVRQSEDQRKQKSVLSKRWWQLHRKEKSDEQS